MYIEYESEFLRAIVGPFPSRFMADEWASQVSGHGGASWEGSTVLTPEEAEEKMRERRAELRV